MRTEQFSKTKNTAFVERNFSTAKVQNSFWVKSLVLIVFVLFSIISVRASVLDNKITVSFKNIPLLEALTTIEKQANITFSFKSSDISQKKRVSLQASNSTIGQVVDQLLAGQRIGVRAIGTQIILYKLPALPEATSATRAHKQTIAIDTLRQTIFDTIKVFDTIRITRLDSIRVKVYDTVRTEMPPAVLPLSEKPSFYSIELRYTYLQGQNFSVDAADINTRVETVPFSQSVACLVGITKNRLSLQTGIGCGAETKEYEYSQIKLLSSIIKVPKIENYTAYDSIYFYMKPMDTVWTLNPVTRQRTVYYDSTRIDTSYQRLTTKHIMQSVQVPVFLTVNVIDRSRWNVFVRTGLVFSFVKYKETEFRDIDNQPIAAMSDVKLAPIACAFHASLGASFELYRQLFLCLAPSISYQISNNYSSSNMLQSSALRYGVELGLKKYIK